MLAQAGCWPRPIFRFIPFYIIVILFLFLFGLAAQHQLEAWRSRLPPRLPGARNKLLGVIILIIKDVSKGNPSEGVIVIRI